MKKLLVIFLLLIPHTAHAGEWFTWDETNTKLHIPLTILMIADLGQTLWAQDKRWGCRPIGDNGYAESHEQNPYLSDNPSRGEIWSYFGGTYLLTTGITYVLPDDWSHGFQTGVITMEVIVVNHNYGLGIGVKF